MAANYKVLFWQILVCWRDSRKLNVKDFNTKCLDYDGILDKPCRLDIAETL